jgi:hypothetical protein
MSICPTYPEQVPYTRPIFFSERCFDMKSFTELQHTTLQPDASVTIFINGQLRINKKFYCRTFIGKKDDNGRQKKAYQDFPDRRIPIIATSCGHTRTGVVRKRVYDSGRKHVDYVLNQITKKASDLINKRNKTPTSNHSTSRTNCSLYSRVRSRTPSSTARRRRFWTPVTKFQRKIEVSDKFVEDLVKNTDISKLASSLPPPNRKL